jgi:peptidoglycan/xylan/chitin deacetylase (PgdA/CDA1 family)
MPTSFAGKGSDWDANSPEPVEPICTWAQLRELEAAGCSIQSHSANHRTFSDLSVADIELEARESKATIERELGKPVTVLAYPFDDAGSHPASTDAALHRAGYRAAMHYVGGAMSWPVENCFHLTRIPIWPDSDLSGDSWLSEER